MKSWLHSLLIPGDRTLTPLAYWRERVLRTTLVTASIAAMVPYVPGVILAYQAGFHAVVAVDTVAYMVVLVMALRPSLPFPLRAGSLVVIPAVISLALLSEGGSVAAGAAWLTSFPVMAALFFGLRAAAWSLGVQFILILLVGLAAAQGWLDWGGALANYPEGPALSWLVTGTNVILLSTMLSLGGGFLLQALERTGLKEASARQSLERETEERLELQARMRQGEKLEAMGTLAGGIAHDFNNLLVPILLRTREAMSAIPEGHPVQEALGDIHLSASRAREMVRRILVFSRGEESPTSLVDVDREIQEVAALIRTALPSTIRLELALAGKGGCVRAHGSEIHQVLMNLATNAYHAMKPTGGVLRFQTRTLKDGPGSRIEVTVSDTGIGMGPELQAKAFDPFFSTRPAGEGTGLGLPTVLRIVTALGGSVDLESRAGEGTEVRFQLPLADHPSGEEADLPGEGLYPEKRTPDPTPSPVRSLHVAVVDDEPVVLRATTSLLKRLGHRVSAFPLPEAALDHLREPEHLVDLLLTDFIMPGMTGVELARVVRTLHPDLPMILVSGNLEEPVGDRGDVQVFAEVLAKPYEVEELRDAIARALA